MAAHYSHSIEAIKLNVLAFSSGFSEIVYIALVGLYFLFGYADSENFFTVVS